MIYKWPENIMPLPDVSFDTEPTYNNVRTQMDSGRARQRPRTTQALTLSSASFSLNRLQYAYFVAIWKHKLNNGNDWFTIRIPQPDDTSLTETQVRFAENYRASHVNFENWNITTTLEIFDESCISEDALDLATLAGDELEEVQESIEQLDDIFPADWTL